ncbi:hypothetical protein H6F88_31600 [Oculatella sp. FACHB-28]|uniref:hypothetical protein n=1 Tax=Oculatella sp. FACHB-28 TaxID=2692845 RepID=UPI0016866DE4|nr:hypothetical protein [Oculatella sp. FACHB-28]MBD2060489.1 hypothetical protein [Oculatella sp. FACHB-28]
MNTQLVITSLISGTSLLISLFTAYWNILRGPKYVSPPPRWIVFGLLPESNTLIINLAFTIGNTGSRAGVVDSFYIELTSYNSQESEIFYAWQEGNILGQDLLVFSPNIPISTFIKAGESMTRHYTFFPDHLGFTLRKGYYKLSLYAFLPFKKKPIKLSEQKLEIEELLEPNQIMNSIPTIVSFNLCPKEILKVSSYGNSSLPPSIIEIVRR